MKAVVETPDLRNFLDWPTGRGPFGLLVLSGQMSREEVGTALAAIAEYGNNEEEPHGPELLRALLEQDMIIMAGGLQLRDTKTGVRIGPGCCFGLESWRDWQDLFEGSTPYLGHSPSPRLELHDDAVRLWPDAERADEPVCEFSLADLRGHLEGVRQDLIGFLGLVREWAPYGMGEELAAAFDKHFHISVPL